MIVMLDGKSEIGAHVRSNYYYLNRLRHLIRMKAVTIRILFTPKRFSFFHTYATCSELLFNKYYEVRQAFEIFSFLAHERQKE